jgi:MFS family permease
MNIDNTHQTRWQIALILFFLTSAVESMSMSHVFAFMPVYLQSMHVSYVETWVGILSAVTFVVGLPLVPLWGVWAERYGGKIVVIRSAYVEMIVFVVLALSHSLIGVFAAMMLVGFQLGNTGIMLAAIRQATPDGRVVLSRHGGRSPRRWNRHRTSPAEFARTVHARWRTLLSDRFHAACVLPGTETQI